VRLLLLDALHMVALQLPLYMVLRLSNRYLRKKEKIKD
jgi:hypothetical protein